MSEVRHEKAVCRKLPIRTDGLFADRHGKYRNPNTYWGKLMPRKDNIMRGMSRRTRRERAIADAIIASEKPWAIKKG